MMKSAVIIIVAGFLVFEFLEHVAIPLIWSIKDRKRKSICGVTAMIGKIGEITFWQESEGKIFVGGELWQAVSDFPLSPGDRVSIQKVDGLTLSVIPLNERSE